MRHLVIPTVNVFIIDDSKILLGRRSNTGWMDGKLCPPGGHVEVGETPVVALLREIKEELGVDVKPEDLEFACVVARNTTPDETVAYEFMIRDKSYEFINNEQDKCSGLEWVDVYNLPDDVIGDFERIINSYFADKKPYIELGY